MKIFFLKVFCFVCFLFSASNFFAQDGQWIMTDKGCQVLINNPAKKDIPKWSGECKDGYANGFGKLKYGIVIVGNSKSLIGGEPPRMIEYEGIMVEGRKEGFGKLKQESEDFSMIVYEGSFKNNVMSGEGTLTGKLRNKRKYFGMFSNNCFNGIGSLYNKNGEHILTGFWMNDSYMNIYFWKKGDFSSEKIYDSYRKISITQLKGITGQYISIDTVISRNGYRFFGAEAHLHADFSEDSKLFYSNAFGQTMIFDCEKEGLTKTNIDSLEEKYSSAYKIQLADNRAFNASYSYRAQSRDYCFDNNKYIYVEKFDAMEWKGMNNYYTGGVRIFDYKSDSLLGEYYLNPDPKEFKKETSASNDYLSGLASSVIADNSGDFYSNLGGLIGASILEGMNAKPDLGLVHAIAVNPKYNYIVSSHMFYKDIHIWATNKNDKTKLNNSAPVMLLKGHEFTPSHFLFDPSGNYLVSVETGVDAGTFEKAKISSILWDMTNRKKIRVYDNYFAESISKDGRFLILSRKYRSGKELLTLKPEFIVVEIASGEIVYEYKKEVPVGIGAVTSAYFSPDQKKIGIACLFNPGVSKAGANSDFYGSYSVIYPDYDFTPKISEEAKNSSLQSVIPFPVNKSSIPYLLPFAEVLNQKLKTVNKPEVKSEFETPDEYNVRVEKHYLPAKAIVQKYWELGAGFYIETVNKKEVFTCKPTALIKYDAVATEYTISISGYEAKIKIPALEAKALKEKGVSTCTVTGEKAMDPNGLCSYKNLLFTNPETGKSYSGNFTNSFSLFISN